MHRVKTNASGWPFEVLLPPGILPEKKGIGLVQSVILADAVRQVDFRYREMELVCRAPQQILEEVLDKLLAVMDEE